MTFNCVVGVSEGNFLHYMPSFGNGSSVYELENQILGQYCKLGVASNKNIMGHTVC